MELSSTNKLLFKTGNPAGNNTWVIFKAREGSRGEIGQAKHQNEANKSAEELHFC